MLGVARRPRRPDRDALLARIDPLAAEHQRAHAKTAFVQIGDKIADDIGDHLLDRFGGRDRLDEPPRDKRHLERHDGDDRLGHMASSLVEPLDGAAPEPARERSARHGIKVCDALNPEARRRGQRLRREPERTKRQRRKRLRFLPFRQNQCRRVAKARERVRGAGGSGDRDTRGETESAQERHKPRGEARLAAEEMRRAGKVEPEPVARSDRGIGLGYGGMLVAEVQEMLARYGYDIEPTGDFEEKTMFVVTAFQRHFRPARVDGRIDQSTITTLERLLAALPENQAA